jgi:dGTPase
MGDEGGFEGNAQTLRILSRLEKRQHESKHWWGIDDDGTDKRCGQNLTARSLAAVLKYDNKIPLKRKSRERGDTICKGFYRTEEDLVRWIKRNVAPRASGKFKTVECQIMDIADDIAYSTYDLEDPFKRIGRKS